MAKRQKDFTAADRLRDQLREKGVTVRRPPARLRARTQRSAGAMGAAGSACVRLRVCGMQRSSGSLAHTSTGTCTRVACMHTSRHTLIISTSIRFFVRAGPPP
eukprot:4456409-Pleurochrysis_carterae.AAC.1